MDTKSKKSRTKSKEYPACTLDKAISFVSKFKDFPQNKQISYGIAAEKCNVSANTKSFRYTLSAARQYRLIATSTRSSFVLLPAAMRLIRPTETNDALQALKVECFSNPKLYSELITAYSGKSIPALAKLENVLITYHDILPTAAKKAAETFIGTANEVGVVQNGILSVGIQPVEEHDESATPETEAETLNVESTLREGPPTTDLTLCDEFASPLNIPFGDKRRAILYMPIDATPDDAEYVKAMVALMFKKVYGVE